MAIELGRQAFVTSPAEALLVAGGAWRSLESVPILERIRQTGDQQFRRRVLGLHEAGRRAQPNLGWGRLIDSLHGAGATKPATSVVS
jgi:hypothetical protein